MSKKKPKTKITKAERIERLRKRVDILEELYLRSSADAKTTVG